MLLEDGGGEFLGFGSDDQTIAAVGTEQEGIDVMDVDLRLQQNARDVLELGLGLQFDRHHRDGIVREPVGIEDFLGALG